MIGANHRWQGQTLISLGVDELREILALLVQLQAEATGHLELTSRAIDRMYARELWHRIAVVDRALDAHRPLSRRLLTATPWQTPTVSPSST